MTAPAQDVEALRHASPAEPPTVSPPSATASEAATGSSPSAARRRRRRGPDDLHPRPGHIPGLDGIRALAIIGVLVYHLVPTALPGGFLGVDVFFVLSGFLITTLLARELTSTGRVDLPQFWLRRARRLLPALLTVVVLSVAAARLVGGDLLVGIGRQVLGALTFSTNWLEIFAGSNYFSTTSPVLFVNFWSLAVEEQFYLLWPLGLVLVVALARGTRDRVAAVTGLALASAVLMAVLLGSGDDGTATRVYYGTDTHLIGLMLGAGLAFAWADPRHRAGLRSATWRRWRGVTVVAALLVLVLLMRVLAEGTAWTFRGGILLASLATVVLIAGLLEADGPWRRLMQVAPLRWLGQRSYGLYLWHWPVIVVATALVPFAPGTPRAGLVLTAALLISLLLTELSFRFIELPIRRHGFRATLRRVGAWVATPWGIDRTPRLVGSVLAALLVATPIAIATAPEKSQTQQEIEAQESRLEQLGTEGTAEGTADGAASGAADGETGIGAGLKAGTAPGDTPATEAEPGQEPEKGQPESDGEKAADDAKGEPDAARATADYSKDDDGLLVPDGSAMTAIGDSLVVTSADGLTYRFPGINYDAKSNRQWKDIGPLLKGDLDSDLVRDNVVLHAGTNAGVDEQALRGALDALGPKRQVVVMNLYGSSSFVPDSNAAIKDIVADYPLAVVGDWEGAISEQPEALQSDGIHPDIEGMHVYAEVVARAFDTLARSD